MPTIPETFRNFSVERISRSEKDIDACLDRLTDAQVLHRTADHENAVANLLLHLSGNIRQWILCGIGGERDSRTRDAEFVIPTLPVPEIRARFAATLAQARAIIAAVPDDRLLAVIDPQPGSGWEAVTILEAIMLVVGHLQLHTGQIILLTKQLAGVDLDLSIPRKR